MRKARLPPAVGLGLLLLSVPLTGWWAWTYTGPYRWIAEAQLQLFDAYYIQLTFLLTLLVPLLPPALILRALQHWRGPVTPSPRAQQFAAWTELNPRKFAFALVSVGLIGLGGAIEVRALFMGSLQDVDLNALPENPPMWVRLSGARPLPDWGFTVKENHGEKTYMPLAGTSSQPPFRVFTAWRHFPDDEPLEGTLEEGGLPGFVRVGFEQGGLVGERHWLFRPHDSPKKWMEFGFIILGTGGMVGAIAAFLIARSGRE